MGKLIFKLTAAISVCLVPIAARSAGDVRTLLSVGGWNYVAGIVDDGASMCGLSANPVESHYMVFRVFPLTKGVELDLNKPGWQIPSNTPIRLSVTFDNEEPGIFSGMGGPQGIEIPFAFDAIPTLVSAIATHNEIYIAFLKGNEAPWRFSLSGTASLTPSFMGCIEHLQATQTQPF